MLEPMGLAAGPTVPTREWRELYAALDCAAVAAIHPFYTASVREFVAAGRARRGFRAGRPRRHRSLAAGHRQRAATSAQGADRRGQEPLPARHSRRAGQDADQGPHHRERLRRQRAARGPPAHRERRRGAVCRHRLPADALVGARSGMAAGPWRARAVPRQPGAGHRRGARVPARPGHRHHAGRAGRQGRPRSRRCTSPT